MHSRLIQADHRNPSLDYDTILRVGVDQQHHGMSIAAFAFSIMFGDSENASLTTFSMASPGCHVAESSASLLAAAM
jgi:hypothetical protein